MRSKNRDLGSDSNKPGRTPVTPPRKVETRPSIIGASLQFVGEIRSAGSVSINGQVKGKVTALALTVGRRGGIEGKVAAQTARIDGLVQGDLEADTVILGPNAQVIGDITHRSLAMEPGARFEGKALLSKAEKSIGESKPERATPPGTAVEKPATRPN
jgi:cytoskeletal protein CcmA (bactofilin family)